MENNFTQGKIMKPLLLFTGPILLALFLQALYGGADLLVVGQFSDAANVSAVSVGSQLMSTITNVIISFSMGTTIYIGQKIGEGREEDCGKIIGTTIILFLSIGILLTLFVPLLSLNLAKWMNSPQEALYYTRNYIYICGLGSIMIVAYNVIGSIFRGLGDSKTPLITVMIAAIMNIIVDIILVGGFNMGASGAALATVLSQMTSVLVSLLIIRKRKLPFTFTKQDLKFIKKDAFQIIKFGFPIATQEFMVSMSFLIILAIVNKLGVNASAGVGIAEKVCVFIMLVPSAFMQAMSAFVAQNRGANKLDRAMQGLKGAIGFSVVLGIVMFYITFFHGDLLVRIFSSDPIIIENAFAYLKAYGIDCLFTCIMFCMVGFYNGLGKTRFVMIQGISAAFFIRVPVSYIMSIIMKDLFYIGLAIPTSTLYQITLCIGFFIYLYKKGYFTKENKLSN